MKEIERKRVIANAFLAFKVIFLMNFSNFFGLQHNNNFPGQQIFNKYSTNLTN